MTLEQPRATLPTDRRPAYPEVIAFGAPRGFRARLQARARQDGTSVSGLVRRALDRELSGISIAEPASSRRVPD